MIALTDITLTHPDGEDRITAVDHVSLEVAPGTLTAVTGPSGAGKSSLLAIAATLIRPDSGRVVVAGTDTTGLSRAESARLRREHIGLVFQQSNLLPALTVTEQLLVMREALGGGHRDRAAARSLAAELLAAVGLEKLADRRPHQLSGGQRQRVSIARSLMNSPAVLLADEPTSALDSERAGAIIGLIADLTRQRETATLLVTHDLSRLASVDAVLHMVDGAFTTPVSR